VPVGADGSRDGAARAGAVALAAAAIAAATTTSDSSSFVAGASFPAPPVVAAASPPAVSFSVTIKSPCDTLSPTLTLTDPTTPPRGAGVSKKPSAGGLGFDLPELAEIDFSQYGEVETKPLSKIQKLSGSFLHRNWLTVPHVTQFGDADITEMDAFRKTQKTAAAAQGIKLTPLVFIMKAVVAALKAFPTFNSSLSPQADALILKKYFHIGVAVDTPNGLVVPVVRDVDKKSMFELAKELGVISTKAREKGLSIPEMQGSCFTISSLGGIGGTAFTPIVNLPDVAILGVSKAQMKPVYQDKEFVPRLMLPLSLSYDHRVIDGAAAARFMVYLTSVFADIRGLLM